LWKSAPFWRREKPTMGNAWGKKKSTSAYGKKRKKREKREPEKGCRTSHHTNKKKKNRLGLTGEVLVRKSGTGADTQRGKTKGCRGKGEKEETENPVFRKRKKGYGAGQEKGQV